MTAESPAEPIALRPSGLVQRLLDGQPLALARAISEVENETRAGDRILEAIRDQPQKAFVVGITGPPGAGKSTLIDSLIAELRSRHRRIGVLAVDPSSPLTGGAVLGDRIRMSRHTSDPGVFVRSLASRGELGGLSPTISRVIRVMDAAGPDVIIVETVGSGQLDVAITGIAHTNVLVCAPGLGDDVQAMKAGILEIADVLVVNKSDNPLSHSTEQQLRAMLSLRGADRPDVAVIATTASTGRGIPALADVLLDLATGRAGAPGKVNTGARTQREFADATARVLRRHIEYAGDRTVAALCARVMRRELDVETAASEFLKPILSGSTEPD